LIANFANAEVFDFEDAETALGHGGDPANFYQVNGLVFTGSYFGVISGTSNGDPGNFKLEGTNGPASLAATSIPAASESIEMSFSSTLNTLCFDLGAAYFNQTQTPVPLDIRIISSLNGIQQSNQLVTLEDALKNGEGTWYLRGFTNIDKISLEAVAGGGTWAVDNIVTDDQSCILEDDGLIFPVVTPDGRVTVIIL